MASDIRSRIGIDGEASYRQAIKAIIQDQSKLKKEMTETAKAFSSNASEQEKARTRSQQLTRQLDLANAKLKEQKDALKALEDAGKGSTREAQNLRNSIKVTEAEIASLNKELKQNSQLAAFGRDMQEAGKKLQSIGGKISGVGDKLTKGVTLPLAAAGAAAVKLAVEFESSMAKLDTIADSSEKSIGDLRKEIMALSDATGISASELAEQTYQAISAGRSTGEAVQFVAKTTRLARAGFTETGSALDVLTTILNAYGKSESEVAKISDQLITTQNLGKTTVGQLAENMGQVIPTAAAFGVSLENLNAAYVTLTKQGISTAGSTTRINGLLNQLGKSGTTSAKVIKEKTGKSFKELMDSGASLADVLKIVKDEAEANGLSLSDMFGNVRAGQAALAIMNDDGVTFSQSLEAMGKAAGSTDQAFAKLEKTTAFKFEKSLNRVKNSGIEAGQALLIAFAPTLEKIANVIEKAAKKFDSLTGEEQQALVKTLAFAAAVGPATKALGGLTSSVGSAIEGAGKLAERWGLASGALTEMSLTGVGALVGLSAALAAWSIKYERSHNDFLKGMTEDVRESQKVVESVRQEADARKSSIAEIQENGKKAKELAKELENLNKKTNRTEAENQKMKDAVASLNSIYPQLNLSLDEHTGNLTKDSREALKNVDALKKQALAMAYQQQYAQIAEQRVKVELQLEKAQKANAKAADTAKRAYESESKALMNTGNAVSSVGVSADEAAIAHGKTQKAVDDLQKEYDGLTEELSIAEKYLDANTEATGELADANAASADSAYMMAEGLEAEAEEAEEAAAKIVEAGKLQVGVFDEVAEAQKTSLDEMAKGLRSQIEAYNNWSSNLQKATAYANKSGSKEINALVDVIAKMGTQGAPYMQALVDAIESGSDDAIAELAGLLKGAQDAEAGYEEALGGYVASTMKTFSSIPKNLRSAGVTIAQASNQSMSQIQKSIAQNSASAAIAARTAGTTVGQNYNQGVSSQNSGANAAGKGLTTNAEAGMRSGTGAKSAGSTQGANYATGVRSQYNAAKSAGAYLSEGLAAGIKSKASYINSTASNVASVAIKTMRNVAQVKSPSRVTKEIGGYLSEGLAIGMKEGLPMVTSAATKIANAAIPSVNPYASFDSNRLNPDEMYAAVRSGASQATQQIFLNTRELTRGLKSMGVVFNE